MGSTGSGERAARSWAFALLGVALLIMLVAAWGQPAYGPDTWAMWDLAQSFRHGEFLTSNIVRQYQFSGPHQATFPYGWPLGVAALSLVTGLGFRTPSVAAVAVAVLLAIVIERRFGARSGAGIGAIAVLGLLLHPAVLGSVTEGGTGPAAGLLVLVAVLAAQRRDPAAPAIAGLLLGVAATVRFDVAPMAVGLMALFAWHTDRGQRLRRTLVAGASAALGALPWVIYSLATFGVPWASDNARAAFAVDRSHVTDYFASSPRTVLDAPATWVLRIVGNIDDVLVTAAAAVVLAVPAVVLVVMWSRSSPRMSVCGSADEVPSAFLAQAAIVVACITAGSIVLTGYTEVRYFSTAIILGVVAVASYSAAHSERQYAVLDHARIVAHRCRCGRHDGGPRSDWRSGGAF